MTTDDQRTVGDLARAIDESDFAWSLVLVGEDQSSKLAALTADLRGAPSSSGDGKQITSGYSYWGTGPAIAWARACSDPFYMVMKQSLASFGARWRQLEPNTNSPAHYVSFGVGTGHKDRLIVETLLRGNPDMFYLPVDMSSEMLRLGTQESTRDLGLRNHRVVPVQLDISIPDNLVELRSLLNRLVGDEPVLFSLLGNTLANFDDDVDLLADLASAVRPQDSFLLEVATTRSLSDDLAKAAIDEYERSRAFREFVTSALLHNTDISIDMDSVLFRGAVEGQRALRVKVIYQNRTGGDLQVMLPDRTRITFPVDDTIRLLLTRKYARKALEAMLTHAGLHEVAHTSSDFPGKRAVTAFGMELVLARPGEGGSDQHTPVNRAEALWGRE